eukprot:COSAG01_NODE_13182_length_1624_cov_0.878689_2_plen_213_part_01
MWVANHDTDNIAIIDIANSTARNNVVSGASKVIADRAAYHYMEKITSLAFSPHGMFATCQDSLNAYNGMQAPNHFMGPTLFSSTANHLVDSLGNDNCTSQQHGAWSADGVPREKTCFFTHFDMLHEAPMCKGIAHDPETATPYSNVFWVFEGLTGMLMRFDFESPHGPGSLDHSTASVRRYPEINFTSIPPGAPSVPAHIMIDPSDGVLYVSD